MKPTKSTASALTAVAPPTHVRRHDTRGDALSARVEIDPRVESPDRGAPLVPPVLAVRSTYQVRSTAGSPASAAPTAPTNAHSGSPTARVEPNAAVTSVTAAAPTR